MGSMIRTVSCEYPQWDADQGVVVHFLRPKLTKMTLVFDLDDLSKSCQKTPACCDIDVLSGPPLKTLQCTSLEVSLVQGPGIFEY